MKRHIFAGILSFALLFSTVGVANADENNVIFDDSYTLLHLDNEIESRSGTKSSIVNYSPQMKLRVFNVDQGDAVKIRMKKKGKVLYDRRCVLRVRDRVGATAISDGCWSRHAALNVFGDLDIEILLMDDSEETESLLRTLKVHVMRTWRLDRIIKGKQVYSPRFQVSGRDMAGLSYAWFRKASEIQPFGDVYFYFWANIKGDTNVFRDPSWRCKRDGKSVPEMNVDGHGTLESIAKIQAQDDRMVGKKREVTWYNSHLMWVKPKLVHGKDPNPSSPDGVSTSRYNISQHPGVYQCRLRNEGKTIRQFEFRILEDGNIERHPAESKNGTAGLSLRPGAFFVPVKIIANEAESFFDKKAATKSVGYGHQWPTGAAFKKLFKDWPATFGRPEPKPPKGAR